MHGLHVVLILVLVAVVDDLLNVVLAVGSFEQSDEAVVQMAILVTVVGFTAQAVNELFAVRVAAEVQLEEVIRDLLTH